MIQAESDVVYAGRRIGNIYLSINGCMYKVDKSRNAEHGLILIPLDEISISRDELDDVLND